MARAELSPRAVSPLAADEEEWIIEPRGVGLRSLGREVWRSRHVLRYLGLRALQNRYKATILGWVWLLIRPLIPVLITTLVFSTMAGLQSGPVPYFLFVLLGNAVWHLFEESLMWCTRSIQMHRRLLTKLYFPRIIVLPASVTPALAEFGIHLGLIAAAAGYYVWTEGTPYLTLGPGLATAVGGFLLALGTAFGFGLFTAVLGAETRDMRFTLRYILRFWFFLTPVAYPVALVPEAWRWLAVLNPVTPAVELFRSGLLGTTPDLAPAQIAFSVGLTLVTITGGFWFFTRSEASAVDRV